MSKLVKMKIHLKASRSYILLLSLVALGWLSACCTPTPVANQAMEQLGLPDRVDMVYFYDSRICRCEANPGDLIYAVLFIQFGGEMASDKLSFQSIDLSEPNNAAIVSKYRATSLSLFVNEVRGDAEQIIAIPEILLVKDDDEALQRLIINRISKYFAVEE